MINWQRLLCAFGGHIPKKIGHHLASGHFGTTYILVRECMCCGHVSIEKTAYLPTTPVTAKDKE